MVCPRTRPAANGDSGEKETFLTDTANPYDATPYPPLSYADTHPDHLATVATLLGFEPPPVDDCSVLEIGAAGGGNLIPMADGLPGSRFVGLDYSAVQIASANDAVSALALDNARFVCADIRSMDLGPGQFDYIIAHGIYSWVSPEVRDELLAACSRLLSPKGVAYISYNTYPGWHSLSAVRGMMLHGSKHAAGPRATVEAAVETLQFLRTHSEPDSPLAAYFNLYSELENSGDLMEGAQSDALLLHDLLSEYNDPAYYHEFVAHAGRHGLGVFADADFPSMFPRGISAETIAELSRRVDSRIDLEQQFDFLLDRTFRKSLLARDISALNPSIRPSAELLRPLRVRTRAKMETPFDISGETPASLVAATGARVSTDHPLSKAVVAELAEAAPASLPFDDLLMRATNRLDEPLRAQAMGADIAAVVAANLLQGFISHPELVVFGTTQQHFAARPSAYPQANRVARYFATTGAPTVTNAHHDRVRVEPVHAAIMSLLDGQRDRSQIRTELDQLIQLPDGSPNDPKSLDDLIDQTLNSFAAAALLSA